MKKILITTGGTGGHVIPAKIIAEHLKIDFENKFNLNDSESDTFINSSDISYSNSSPGWGQIPDDRTYTFDFGYYNYYNRYFGYRYYNGYGFYNRFNRWYYPYSVSPTAMDLFHYLEKLSNNSVHFLENLTNIFTSWKSEICQRIVFTSRNTRQRLLKPS